MSRKTTTEMFHSFGEREGYAAEIWEGFVDKSLTKTKRFVKGKARDYLEKVKTIAASRASISKDPDQETKIYPGFLKDSAYATTGRGSEEEVEGKVGFGAPYAAAHHEEAKNYRYGQVKYLETTVQDHGAHRFEEMVREG